MKKSLYLLFGILLTAACISRKSDPDNALKSISVTDLRTNDSIIGSDRFMGRQPFTEGETITINYLAEQLKRIGFEPAFSGSYFQDVPMVEIKSSNDGATISRSSRNILSLSSPDEAAIISPQIKKNVKISNSEIIFAGFGIVAPEYGWNDYEGLDVKGKTVIVLVNDPGLYTGDTTLFKGREMTYYGRWTYKYEEAARQGAAGIIIIHETEGAGYPFAVPRKSSITPRLYLQSADSNQTLCRFTGWLSADAADKLFNLNGMNVSKLRMEACKKDFRGFSMNLQISLNINNSYRYNKSANVAGILRGTERPDECIVYTAHWDHFGIGEKENGDSIYNGAVDNGTAMSWELSVGKAFSVLNQRPQRSIILLFPTAEEQGLCGSIYYTGHPVIPMEKTVACINNDGLLPLGRMKDVMIIGYGQSDLDSLTRIVALKQERYVVRDPDIQAGGYFRSDHFAFAAKGVPSLYAKGNVESREFGKDWTTQQRNDYIENRYHRPSDNYVSGKFNFDGIAEDARLAFTIGYDLANSAFFPKWKKGSEFRKLRNK